MAAYLFRHNPMSKVLNKTSLKSNEQVNEIMPFQYEGPLGRHAIKIKKFEKLFKKIVFF